MTGSRLLAFAFFGCFVVYHDCRFNIADAKENTSAREKLRAYLATDAHRPAATGASTAGETRTRRFTIADMRFAIAAD
jgi:hypothetical protein